MNVLNGDDFQRGWNDGRKDALDGKDRSTFRMGLSYKYIFHGNTTLNSYTDGYTAGYEAGLKEKNVILKVEDSTKPTNKNTPQPNSSTSDGLMPSKKSQTTSNSLLHHQINSKSMDSQRIELQLEALRQLEQFLIATIEDLNERMRTYNDRVSALRSDGLSLEIADNYDANYCIPNNQKLWQVTEAMKERDLQYIHENIQAFEEALERAYRNYNQ